MSSSRPSRRLSSSSVSATVNYNSKPKWRSPYNKDAPAKTTLSLVFAEPEEPKSISPGTAERRIASMHDALNKLPVDTVSEQVIPETRKGSWFGSISRKRKRKDIVQPNLETLTSEEPPNTIPEVQLALPPPTPTNASPTANNDPQPASPYARNDTVEPPMKISIENPPPSWPTTSQPQSEPQNVQGVLSKPTHLDVLSPTISISSVDDVVPQLKTSPVVPILIPSQNPVPITAGGVGDGSTTGTTATATSRFTLRMPLLGRPKVPLNQAISVAQAEDIRDPAPAEPANSDSTTSPSTNTTEETQRPGILTVPSNANVLSEQINQSQSIGISTLEDTSKKAEALVAEHNTRGAQEDPQVQHDTSSSLPSSWWDYVGWGGNHPRETPQLPSISVDVASPMERTESSKTEFLSAVSTESPVFLSGQQSPLSPLPPPIQDSDANDAAQPTSTTSSEGQSSSWLTPWNWYPNSTTTPPPPRSPLPTVEEESERGLTESQMIKEAALARDSQLTSATAQPPAPASENELSMDPAQEDTACPDEINPIRSTIGTNKSGWMSFFVARSIKTITEDGEKKPIENEPGDGEMEVMEVPGPEDLPPGVTATTTPTATVTPENITPPAGGTSTVAAIMNQFVSRPSAPSIKSSSSKTPGSPAQLPKKEMEQEREDKEPKKKEPPAPPLTNAENIKETAKGVSERPSSPSPSKRSGTSRPISPGNGLQNLVLPTWEDTFHAPPRSLLPLSMMRKEDDRAEYVVTKTIKTLWSKGWEVAGMGSVKGKARAGTRGASAEVGPSELSEFGKELPRALNVMGDRMDLRLSQGASRVVVIGIAGWSPGAVTRKIAGGLPSSSTKFVNMTCSALASFEEEHGVKFAKVTKIPLEGDGTVSRKVEKVYQHLLSSEEWVNDIHSADFIFVSAHSQGSIVSTHLVDLLIRDGHIITSATGNVGKQADNSTTEALDGVFASESSPRGQQRVCCLSLCGIHLGPLRYLKLSSFIQPYIQYFENAAAQEIFEFQNTENAVSKEYVKALGNIMHHGAKMVYVASLNDQMVPIYSGIFAAANHPRILRALYIDGDAYHSSDFLSNLLVLLLRIMNAGLSDRGLLTHLSEATAGSLSGVGHSSVYEDPGVFELAVKYQFLANGGNEANCELQVDSFNAVQELNDYEIPWSLRDLIANERVAHFFSREFVTLRDAFGDWQPKTSILRDVKRKLQPIQRLTLVERASSTSPQTPTTAPSKL